MSAACAGPPPAATGEARPTIGRYRHPPLKARRSGPEPCRPAQLVRTEHRVSSRDGASVFIIRVRAPGKRKGAVVFTHGAGSPGSATWDLPGDYSFLRALACQRYDAYALDVRGFGGSSRPDVLKKEAGQNPPAVRAAEVMPDVDAAVAFASRTSTVPKVHLVGWSWGSLVAGMYAGQHPERVDRLVLFAPVYDRQWPRRHRSQGAWRSERRSLYFEYHDPEKEDRRVLEAFVEAMFRFEDGDEVRLPNGPYRDLYGRDAPVWDPAKVLAPTLVIRGDEDRASLEPHAFALYRALKQSPYRRYVVASGVGHFWFRRFRYRELQTHIVRFLEDELGSAHSPAK